MCLYGKCFHKLTGESPVTQFLKNGPQVLHRQIMEENIMTAYEHVKDAPPEYTQGNRNWSDSDIPLFTI